MSDFTFNVTEQAGCRLDIFVSDNMKISRSQAQKLIDGGSVLVNNRTVSKKYKVSPQDEITVYYEEQLEIKPYPQNIPLNIVYEDDDLAIVNKPRGMVVHAGAGNEQDTLVNALLYRYGNNLSHINGDLRPGILHRIDKDTSGLLMIAKNDEAHRFLAEQIKEHTFTREYMAVICGHLKENEGIIDAPIGRNPKDRKKMCVTTENSKNAVTHYKIIRELEGYSHILLKLETGRTHQIRVHLSHLGHPVAGDLVYGHDKKSASLKGQCLHAYKIGFVHPRTHKYMEFSSELPQYFKDFLMKISHGEYDG